MFAALRSSAKAERPLDISVGSAIAAMIAVAGLLAGLVAWLWVDGPSPWLVVGAVVVVIWSIVWVKEVVAHRRLRAARLLSQRVGVSG
jgi:Flp pilus assembly protein TadB